MKKMKCRYRDDIGYCRHRKNSLVGSPAIRCMPLGCPFNTEKPELVEAHVDKFKKIKARRKYAQTVNYGASRETKRHRDMIIKKRKESKKTLKN